DAADRDSREILLLDGGLGTHLRTLGAKFENSPVWSSQALVSAPSLIRQAHLDFYLAGADVAFTATYQASLKGLTQIGLSAAEAAETVRRAVVLADEARQAAMAGGPADSQEGEEGTGEKEVSDRGTREILGTIGGEEEHSRRKKLKVILSNGSYGAALGGGEEYRGNYGVPAEEIQAFHRWRLEAALQSSPGLLDAVVFETLPESAEAKAILSLLREFPDLQGRVWFSFSCKSPTSLSSGENFREVVSEILRLDARHRFLSAVGVNCSPISLMTPLLCEPSLLESLAAPLEKTRDISGLFTLCYPNNEPWRNPSVGLPPGSKVAEAPRSVFSTDRSTHSTESRETAPTDTECYPASSGSAGRLAGLYTVVPFKSSVRGVEKIPGASTPVRPASKTVVRQSLCHVSRQQKRTHSGSEGAGGVRCDGHLLASQVKSWIDGGVTAVGGCCGTSPEDLSAILTVLKANGCVENRTKQSGQGLRRPGSNGSELRYRLSKMMQCTREHQRLVSGT
ncbi:homocysteine methyltransferase, partial [Cystoisospora suis]